MVREWWIKNAIESGDQRKAIASLFMLMSWEIWKERNARVFCNTAATTMMLVAKIKEEAHLWAIAGATHLSIVMPRE